MEKPEYGSAKKWVTIGILAHVDAGKTTLSEAILYRSGTIRNLGRVDKGDTFLDTDVMERKRGITIFSKQAVLERGDLSITLLDTPGHVDFSAEMERTLQVLDYAILLISGADGVQGHTKTLWKLLEKYQIPTFIFYNKMDQEQADKENLLRQSQEELSGNIVDFTDVRSETFFENIAVCSDREELLEALLLAENPEEAIDTSTIAGLIAQRKVFPCFFGAALHMEGVEELLQGIECYVSHKPEHSKAFSARVYKISRDEQGNRLTFCKITSGELKVKTTLNYVAKQEEYQEKINQIRIYSGDKFEAVDVAEKGMVVALTGLTKTYPMQGLGGETTEILPVLEPVMTYQLILPEDVDGVVMLPKIRLLEEEDPQLHVLWDEKGQVIRLQVMGEVQLEILKSMIESRFQTEVSFGSGSILYKETIASPVEGVGHFEPLRHYAEVHLLMEPLECGSGIQIAVDCSQDELDLNWQRLILTHIEEKEHLGVLTGSPITDMKITLKAGKAHLKHTEGGDFRQSTYRAIRQGLMQAESVLLEPFYQFEIEVPEKMIGKTMTDVERMKGSFDAPEIQDGTAVLRGEAPVLLMQHYQTELASYTQGQGKIICNVSGYRPCHNTAEVMEQIGYDPEADLANPSSSVFCAHGAGVIIPWYEVKNYMHLESILTKKREATDEELIMQAMAVRQSLPVSVADRAIGIEEIDAILERTGHANSQSKVGARKWSSYSKGERHANGTYYEGRGKNSYENSESRVYEFGTKNKDKSYLLVDGYNIIFAWQDLKELAAVNIDGARGKLLDILCNYQATKGCDLIVVFDAYRVKGHDTEMLDYHNIHVVYTKEAETADRYIEKFAHEHGRKYDVTVATSDGLEQIIIIGQGCHLISAREFEKEVQHTGKQIQEEYLDKQKQNKQYAVAEALERSGFVTPDEK